MNVMRRFPFMPLMLTVLAIVTSFFVSFSVPVHAATGINQTINFQGKVTNSNGTNVTDGTYDFVFKLYDGASSGSTALFTESWTSAALWSSTMSSAPTSGGESLTYSSNTNESTIKVGQILWNVTKGESVVVVAVNTGTNVITISPTIQAWANGDTVTNKIYVKDGIFRVALNGLNQDLSGVDFNSDTIFFGVNFNNDGEMKPRIQYTAAPYAMNARKVAGLTVTDTTGTLTVPNGKTIQFGDAFTTSGANPLTLMTTSSTNVTLPTTGTLTTLAGTETFINKTIGSTGLTFSTAATDIITGTNEHFSIMPNGTGNVGIGSTAPNAYLLISSTASKDLFRVNDNGEGDASPFIIDQSGNVGIGLTATSAVLDLKSSATNSDVFRIVASDGSRLGRFTETAGGAGWFEVDDSSGTAVALFRGDAGASYISTGNVGIGTTTPTAKLDINGNASISGNLSFAGGARTIAATAMNALTLGDSNTGDLFLQPKGLSSIGIVQIGAGGVGSTAPDFFALDVKSDTGDPSGGFEGAMYYNTFDNKFRCYEGSAWTDCIGSGVGSSPFTDGSGITYLTDTAEDFAIGASSLTAALSVDVSANAVRIGTGSTANGALSMYASDGDTGNITYTTNDGWAFEGGNLGIGTTNAAYLLSVNGTGASDNATQSNTIALFQNAGVTRVETRNATTNTAVILTADTSNAEIDSNNEFMYIGAASNRQIRLQTNGDTILNSGAGFVGVGTTAPSYKLDVVSGNTTGILQLTGNSITSGTGVNLAMNGLTSGKGINVSSTSTSLTSGNLMYLDWSPSSSATATSDLFGINVGANGTVGTLFNLKNNGSSIFSVSQSQITNGLPTTFTAAGDVSLAYDLVFNNQTSSFIKSNAPLYIEAGESFESNDLTLRTYNAGNIIADITGSGGFGVGSGVTPIGKFHVEGKQTGKALAMFNETGDQAILTASAAGTTKFVISNTGNVGIGTTSPTALLDVRGNVYINDGGSAGSPVLSFYNDTNTGLYRAGGDILSFVANGQPGLTLDGTAGVGRFIVGPRNSQPVSRIQIVDDNNNTASGITFGESAGTYMQLYKSASNKLTIGGGYLGIGSTNPGAPLEIQNTATQIKLSYDTSNNSTIGVDSSGYMSFQSAGTAATGRVQIGVGGTGSTTPDYFALDVKSDTGDPSGGFEGAMYYNTFDNKFRCYEGSAWTDCIGSGVGSSPFTDGSGITYLTDTAEDFAIGASSLTAALSVDVSANGVRIGTGSTANGALSMYASDGDTGTLTYSTSDAFGFTGGNVGIGTTAPNNALEVVSTSSPQARFAYDTSNYLTVGVVSNGAVTFDATGAGAGLTFSDAVVASSTLSSTGTVTIGSGGNTFTFDPSSGPLYAGTARPAITMKVTPEFFGSTLTASGSATTNGTMTSDTVRDSTEGWQNYYEWSSTQASLQDYTIAVKITLPSDFGAWATSNALQIEYATENTSNTKNKLDVSVYNMTTNPDKVVYQTLTNVSGTNGVWTNVTVDDSQLDDNTSPDWDTAGQTAVLFLKPYSLVDGANCTGGVDNGCYVRIGDITLNYLGKF